MAVVRSLTTFQQYLNDKRWFFFERGMMATWNELQLFADNAIAGGSAAMPGGGITSFGPGVLGTNFVGVSGVGADANFSPFTDASGRVDAAGNIVAPPTQYRT